MSPHEQMILGSLRYALPRRSYIMSDTEDYIRNMLKGRVSDNFLYNAKRDIEEHIRHNQYVKESLGMHDWSKLLELIESKL